MRRRSRTTRHLGEREIKGRLSAWNTARSQSTAPHDRRKPGPLSTGTPELAGNAVTNPKLDTDAVDGRVVAPTSIGDAHINGRLGAASVPAGTIIGNVQRANIARGAVGDDEISGVGWSKLGTNADPVPNLARQADLAGKLTKNDLKRLLKPSAFK